MNYPLDIPTCRVHISYVPDNYVGRNDRARGSGCSSTYLRLASFLSSSCGLEFNVTCALVCILYIYTRAYVTKKKPHVHACSCRHMCPLPLLLSGLRCPQPPMKLAASQLNPKPHARPASASTLATAGTCSPARELAYAPARPGASCRRRRGHVYRASSGPWPAGLLQGCGRLGLRAAGGWRKTQGICASRPRRSSLRILPLTNRDLRASPGWVVKTTRGL